MPGQLRKSALIIGAAVRKSIAHDAPEFGRRPASAPGRQEARQSTHDPAAYSDMIS